MCIKRSSSCPPQEITSTQHMQHLSAKIQKSFEASFSKNFFHLELSVFSRDSRNSTKRNFRTLQKLQLSLNIFFFLKEKLLSALRNKQHIIFSISVCISILIYKMLFRCMEKAYVTYRNKQEETGAFSFLLFFSQL